MRVRFLISMILLASLMALTTAAWAQETKETTPKAEGATATKPEFQQPVFITDIGQGNTARLVEVMLRRGGKVQFKSDPVAKAEALGDAKTLLIGVGGSTKGLGAAGLDATAETNRMKALIDTAKKAGKPVIGVHMGGMPRRGELSDEFNRYVFEQSDVFILWEGGNEDEFFTRLDKAKSDPAAPPRLVIVKNKPEVGQKLEALFAPKAEADTKPETASEAKPEAKASEK